MEEFPAHLAKLSIQNLNLTTYSKKSIVLFSMPQAELLEFFKANTQDLPDTTQRWFQLPNKPREAVAALDPAALLRRVQAGESLNAILGLIQPKVTPEADAFIAEFFPRVNTLNNSGKAEEAIRYATISLELAAGQFNGDQLSLVRKKIFEGRGVAQGFVLEKGVPKPLPFAHQLRGYCGLSLAVDWMRADLESGTITDRATKVAQGFGFAGMAVLERKVYDKYSGGILIVVGSPPFTIPKDPEIRDIQRAVLAKLIPDAPSQ